MFEAKILFMDKFLENNSNSVSFCEVKIFKTFKVMILFESLDF